MALVLLPYMYVADPTRGRPVFNGKIYIGESDTDPRVIENQKEALLVQEDGSSVPAEYPILTNAGGIPTYNGSPVAIDVLGAYSVAIDDRNGQQVYYYPNAGADIEFLATDLRSIMFDLGYTYSDIGVQLVTSTPDTGLDEAEYLLDIDSGLVWRLPAGIPQSSTVVSVSNSTLTTNNGQFEMITKGNDITQVVPPLSTINGYFRSGMALASGVLLPTNDDFAASEDIVFDWKAGLSGCAGVTVDDDGILFSAADVDYSIVTSVELGAGTQITDANQLTLYLMDNNGVIHYIKNGENSVVIDVTAGVATFEIKSGVFADLGITSIKRAFGLFEVGVVADLSEGEVGSLTYSHPGAVLIVPSNYTPVGDEPDTVITDTNLPDAITNNSRYVLTNPFSVNVKPVIEAQILINGDWVNVGSSGTASGSNVGVISGYIQGQGVVIQTASSQIHQFAKTDALNTSGTSLVSSSSPCRVWCFPQKLTGGNS